MEWLLVENFLLFCKIIQFLKKLFLAAILRFIADFLLKKKKKKSSVQYSNVPISRMLA